MPSSSNGSHSLTLMTVGGRPSTCSRLAKLGQARGLRALKAFGPGRSGKREQSPRALIRFLRVTNLSARFHEQDRNGGLGLGGRENADGRARQSKRRWKELGFRLS